MARTKKKAMSRYDVVQLMKAKQGEQSMRDFAEMLTKEGFPISHTQIIDIYKGRREPGKAILECFGLIRTRRVIFDYYHK